MQKKTSKIKKINFEVDLKQLLPLSELFDTKENNFNCLNHPLKQVSVLTEKTDHDSFSHK